MSTISSVHSIIPFIAGKTQPMAGNRLCKVGYKETKNTPAKYPSVAVSVPPVVFDDYSEEGLFYRLSPHLNEYLQTIQDKIVRSLYESSEGKKKEIHDSDISMEQVIAFLESESSGNRMTKEMVEVWFDRNLKDNLTVAVCEKLGKDDLEDKEVAGMVNSYRGLYSALSGGATLYAKNKVDQLLRALEFSVAEDNSGIGERLSKRLNDMKMEKKEIELADL